MKNYKSIEGNLTVFHSLIIIFFAGFAYENNSENTTNSLVNFKLLKINPTRIQLL